MRQPLQISGWEEYQALLVGFFRLKVSDRVQYLFRGQGQTDWSLKSTIDRYIEAEGIASSYRPAISERLLAEFQTQAADFLPGRALPSTPVETELLARHHGVPTSILDWTRSPYVGLYFGASAGSRSSGFTVWLLDRERVVPDEHGEYPVEFLEAPEYTYFNIRATEQDAVAVRVGSFESPLETLLSDALWRLEFPPSARQPILDRLASMRITARTLFRSMDHAAETAKWRVAQEFPR